MGGVEGKLQRPFEYGLKTYTCLVMCLSAVCVENIYWPNRIGAGKPRRLKVASLRGGVVVKSVRGIEKTSVFSFRHPSVSTRDWFQNSSWMLKQSKIQVRI